MLILDAFSLYTLSSGLWVPVADRTLISEPHYWDLLYRRAGRRQCEVCLAS